MREFKLSNPLLSKEQYEEMYAESFSNKEQFWSKVAKSQLTWTKDFTKVKNTNYDGDVSIKWFEDGELNVCYNCVDRHAETQPNEIAVIWEGDDTSKNKTYTYKELKSEVSKFANVLKKLGVQKGDVVTIYLTMIPEVAFAMLACARIGAIHSVIFGGFAPESIAGRIKDCKSQFVITADEGVRGGKIIPLKKYINTALESCDSSIKTLVIQYTNTQDELHKNNNFYYDELVKEGTLDSQMRLENLDELLTSAFEFENLYEEDIEDPFTVLRDYLESIALFTDSDDVDKEDRILLMTLHNAKGLEFPVVFMTGMEENIFPSQRSETDFEIQEERRLCYVGMTRAEKKLYLTYSNTRTMWGGTNYYLPSRFIDEAKPYLKEIKIHQESTDNKSNSVGSLGKKVIHEKYGSGIVEEVNGNEITVNFGGEHGIKHLDIEWAPIIFE